MGRWFMAALVAVLTAGCSGMQVQEYAGETPALVLEEYFVGELNAWGQFQDRAGRVKRRFRVDLQGRMEGEELVLEEDFHYADGTTERRVWRVRRLDEHSYEGRANDVVGTASGKVYGNAFHWVYTLRLPYRDDTIDVKFDDWMFLHGDGVLVNRAEMTKFGFRVGEVTLFFRKEDPA